MLFLGKWGKRQLRERLGEAVKRHQLSLFFTGNASIKISIVFKTLFSIKSIKRLESLAFSRNIH